MRDTDMEITVAEGAYFAAGFDNKGEKLSERYTIRISYALVKRIDHWRSSQPDSPSRAEAMRRLLELGCSG